MKRKVDCQIRMFFLMQLRTNEQNAQLKKKCFFVRKMWKTFICGQNRTKHKVGPSWSLDPFYFC